MYRAFPSLVKDVMLQELLWELRDTELMKIMHYILNNVAYHAPWLHHAIAPDLLEWVLANPLGTDTNRRYCLQILANGGINPAKLAVLASQQIIQSNEPDSIPWWYALRVDCDPVNGIPEFEQWLSALDADAAPLRSSLQH
jgi:hypothetical protein